jgi:hypothetical protein
MESATTPTEETPEPVEKAQQGLSVSSWAQIISGIGLLVTGAFWPKKPSAKSSRKDKQSERAKRSSVWKRGASMRSSSLFVTLQGGTFMIQLLGKNTAELEATLKEAGQPAFRGRQIAAWIYRKGATSFDEMTDLPKTLREQLSSTHEIGFPHVAAQHQSRDGSTKLLLQMGDNERIETVRLPYPDRVSVCVSSQAGCAMACQFCATGIGGFRRNLSTAEIIAQPLLAMTSDEKLRNVPTHIVFMGMGEPLLNLNNVLPTLSLMHEEMGIPYRHITVSTVGIIPGIERLAEVKFRSRWRFRSMHPTTICVIV